MEQVTIIPILVSAIGVVPKNLYKCLEASKSEGITSYIIQRAVNSVCIVSERMNSMAVAQDEIRNI
jgi:hypothetical protein